MSQRGIYSSSVQLSCYTHKTEQRQIMQPESLWPQLVLRLI